MAMSQSQIEAMIDACYEAEKKVLLGKSYSLNGRALTMENLNEIRNLRREYEKKLRAIKSTSRPRYSLSRFV